jgi:hypothetical protein
MTLHEALARLVTRDATWVDNMATTLAADGLELDDLEWLAQRVHDVGAKNPRGLLRTWLENGDWKPELRYRVLDKSPGDSSILPELDDRAWRASHLVVFDGRTVGDAAGIVGIEVSAVEESITQLAPTMRALPCGHWTVPVEGKKPKCYRCKEGRP